jgi:hypothetical protein
MGDDPQEFVFRGTDGKTRCGHCAAERLAAQRSRSEPAAVRAEQQTDAQDATDRHRALAQESARKGNGQSDGASSRGDRGSDHEPKKKPKPKKDKKSRQHHPKPKGK